MGRLPFQGHGQPAASSPALDAREGPSEQPAAPAPRKLTARQQAFIDHYVVSRNASDAARKAGYAEDRSNVAGSELVANRNVKAEIDRRLSELAAKNAITAERVLAEIGNVAFLNMRNYLGSDGLPTEDFSRLAPEHTAAIKSITVEEFKDGRSDKREVRRLKFQLADKEKGLEMLAKHFGLFAPEQHEHKHQHTVLGVLLAEIDSEARGPVIEHEDAA